MDRESNNCQTAENESSRGLFSVANIRWWYVTQVQRRVMGRNRGGPNRFIVAAAFRKEK
jgi:hypothetical protein